MKLITAADMRECDRRTIEGIGLPGPTGGLALMERAGWGIFAALRQQFSALAQRPILIFCGRGNNGGDGLVVARLLAQRGCLPHVFLLADPADLTPDARVQWDRCLTLKAPVQVVAEPEALHRATDAILKTASLHRPLVIDAILGTGSRGAPRGLLGAAVSLIEELRLGEAAEVLAVDLPTGVDADTGQVAGEAVTADLTVTMAYAKAGFYAYPARSHLGRLRIADIGIPRIVEEEVGLTLNLMTLEEAGLHLPGRARDAHKGALGRVLIVGGSPGLSGAPALAAEAALRAGAGLVTIALPQGCNQALEAKLTEVMTYPCPEGDHGGLTAEAASWIRRRDEVTDVWAVGPGIGRNPDTQELVRELVKTQPGPIVVDADGLFALAGGRWERSPELPVPVLTPHPGEMRRLEEDESASAAPPWERASAYAREQGCVLILKGAPTVIAAPDGQVWVNPTGNPGLATGGSGDALTGILAALLGQGCDPVTAGRVGVFLHGFSADLASEVYGEAGLLPTDLIQMLPAAWGEIEALEAESPENAGCTEYATRIP